MTLGELLAIAEKKAELPADKVNVRVPQGLLDEDSPLIRRLIRVEFRMYGKQRWIYWYWTPEAPGPGEDLGALDCGYSGRRLSPSDFPTEEPKEA